MALSMKDSSLILFAHGARDARWAEPFRRLRDIIAAQVPDTHVELAFLEFMEPALPALVDRLVREGCTRITVVPVFFGQGGHVLRDLPAMMETLRKTYPMIALKVTEAVGESPDVLQAIARYCLSNLDA
jgi:sirohydrochlorin cobaltochelatase